MGIEIQYTVALGTGGISRSLNVKPNDRVVGTVTSRDARVPATGCALSALNEMNCPNAAELTSRVPKYYLIYGSVAGLYGDGNFGKGSQPYSAEEFILGG